MPADYKEMRDFTDRVFHSLSILLDDQAYWCCFKVGAKTCYGYPWKIIRFHPANIPSSIW
jgi:hypothetical protein